MNSPIERAVVTGSGGFVGTALCAGLRDPLMLRFATADWRSRLDAVPLEDATVFHLAARVHTPGSDPRDYVRDNVDKTRALAERAAARGARRLVFLSSIKVHGEESGARPFRESDVPAPEDDYGRSKWAAEQALTEVAERARMPFCVVRSPLPVYGPRVGGNLATLLRIADSPLPLPFAKLDARRSFVHRDDLAELLIACAVQPAAVGRTFLAAHAEPVSAARLLTLLRAAFGRPARLFRVPAAALETGAALTGLRVHMHRLTRALEADSSAALRELGWSARVPIERAVEEMVRAYREVRQ